MKNISKSKEQKILNFVQELSWLVDSNKDVSVNDVYDLLVQKKHTQSNSFHTLQSDTRYLVGVLPEIFQDLELFPKKEDILSFAEEVLGIMLKSTSKRSRIEYIGTILCQVSNMESGQHEKLVEALDKMLGSENFMTEVKRRKRVEPNFSWNDTINELKLL